MKSYYSILSITPSAASKDSYAVGLVLADQHNIYHEVSYDKLALLKKLFSFDAYLLIKDKLKSLENTIPLQLKDELSKNPDHLKMMDYFSYMSGYANNLVQFSKPKVFSLEANADLFQTLFHDYITFEKFDTKVAEVDFTSSFKLQKEPRIKPFVNIDYTITPASFIPNVVAPFELDFIGKNGNLVSGEYVDFEKKVNHLYTILAKYLDLVTLMHEHDKGGTYYLIGKEPSKSLPKNHLTWSQVRQRPNIEYVEFKEFDRVENHLATGGVRPLDL